MTKSHLGRLDSTFMDSNTPWVVGFWFDVNTFLSTVAWSNFRLCFMERPVCLNADGNARMLLFHCLLIPIPQQLLSNDGLATTAGQSSFGFLHTV